MAQQTSNRMTALGYAMLFFVFLSIPLSAFTQNNDSQEAQSSSSNGSESQTVTLIIEEILVTSERRETSLQETAISISAFSADQIARSGIENSEQLTGFTPGLNIQRDIIGKVVIRGIGTENFTIAGDPGVAISLDGAYQARANMAIFDFFDLERIEVLRGPQGTLYGRNATGGAINFISKKPTEEFEAYISADVGNYGKFRVEGAISGALGDGSVTGRLSLMSNQRDGYTQNIFPNVGRGLDELDDKDLWAVRGQLSWQASDSVTVDLQVNVSRDDSIPAPYKYVDDPLVYFGGLPFPNPLAEQLRVVSQGYEFDIPGFDFSVPSAGRSDQTGFLATITWDMPSGMTFKSLTALRDVEFDWLNDGDGIEAYLVTYFQGDESDLFTQEFQLISDSEGPLTWVAGLYYLEEDSTSSIGIPLPLGFGLPFAVIINGRSDTKAYAVFGDVSYDLTDKWQLNLGARYSYEEKSAFYVDDRTSLGAPAPGIVDGNDDWNSITPKIGLNYFWRDDVMFHGSITKGFKSGGFNLLAIQPSYDEEEVLSFEIGVKSRFNEGRTQLNASAFYYDYTDLQVGKVIQLNATIENAAQATIYGAEIELQTLVTQNFQINWGVSILETEYDDFSTGDKDLPGIPDVSLAGNDLPRSPNLTSSVSGLFTIPLADSSSLEFWGNWQYTASQFFTPFNRPNFEQKSYNVLNARMTYRKGDKWDVSLYANNVNDEEYFTNALESGVPFAGIDRVVPQFFLGAPRTWGVRFTYYQQ